MAIAPKLFASLAILSTLNVTAQTRRIEFEKKGLYPEGTVYDDAGKRFFVSSATTADIGSVDAAGKYTVFYSDSNLRSSFGMKIDPVKKKLWICVGDPNYSLYQTPATFRHQIRLIALDLATAKKSADIDLSNLFAGPHFANDLTIDEKGNIYITDSFSPVIYRVDAAGKATLFQKDDLFAGTGIGLNGIAWNKQGYLLVANGATGSVIKIPVIKGMAGKATVVKIFAFFPGADGILFDGMNLLVVQNKGVNKISRLSTTDDWTTAIISGSTSSEDRFAYPSTLTKNKEEIYALNAKLNELTDSTQPRSGSFSLQLVSTKPAK